MNGEGGPPAGISAQYADSSNLAARMSLHERFGSGGVNWHRWVHDQIEPRPGERVLEVGCGPARLWMENLDRRPDRLALTLTDVSGGMVGEARRAFGRAAHTAFALTDCQRLAFRDAAFDVVTANHMLYHVPDVDGAIAEFRRVLRPGGRLVVATNGAGHMSEVVDLVGRHLETRGLGAFIGEFSLESGSEALARHFVAVELRRAPAAPLLVTDTGAVLDYIRSTGRHVERTPGAWVALEAEIAAAIARDGHFRIARDTGAFACT